MIGEERKEEEIEIDRAAPRLMFRGRAQFNEQSEISRSAIL